MLARTVTFKLSSLIYNQIDSSPDKTESIGQTAVYPNIETTENSAEGKLT